LEKLRDKGSLDYTEEFFLKENPKKRFPQIIKFHPTTRGRFFFKGFGIFGIREIIFKSLKKIFLGGNNMGIRFRKFSQKLSQASPQNPPITQFSQNL